ncbi:MAG: choice-of-anchor D domain-containing protein [Gammaproteobacteria bacterium]|nr:choice-of-anchor D domain-containing protein [Gammaproteobacteria bacterium]
MKTGILLRGAAALIILTVTTLGLAVPVAVDTTITSNGITDLYSATFDSPITPCTGSSPSYCAFFGGDPPVGRDVVVTPTPTTVINGVPLGITPTPAAGSYLNLTLNGTNTQLTITGGTIAFPSLLLTIRNTTVVTAIGGGVVFDVAPQTAAVDANGVATFLVDIAPSTVVDFSAFTTVAFAPIGSCAGPLCSLISILTLDMVRYRLVIDYDPTFTYFTANFIGQTANNSMLFITMNSAAAEIEVTDSKAPAADLQVPFGSVTESATATQTVTVTNAGTSNLLLGAIALANPLAAPFTLANDTCTGATVLPAAACTFNVRFSPDSSGNFADSLDIPSNDADEPSVTVAVSGIGVAIPVPAITVTDSRAPDTDHLVPFGSVGTGAQLNQTVTVTNNGNANLVLGSVAVANALLAPFSITADNCSDQTVAPAGNCVIDVQFEPTAPGDFSDAFDIPSNDPDPDDASLIVSVSGTGIGDPIPNIVVTDDTLPADDQLVPFGNITENTTRDRTITVTNSGSLDLVLGAIAITNPLAEPFSLVTNNCSNQTLAPATSCSFMVRYAPLGTGAASDSLDIPSNDPDEDSVTVSVTGTGITRGEGGAAPSEPGGTDGGFMAIDPATLLLLSAAGAWGLRRRRR